MRVFIHPQPAQYPQTGGVRTHLVGLRKAFTQDSDIELVDAPIHAEVILVESSWEVPRVVCGNAPRVYVCHGGFIPPILSVQRNLEQADFIVSVAQWIVDRFFPQYQWKTVVIPNGIDLSEFHDVWDLRREFGEGYILYGKHYAWDIQDLYTFAELCPDRLFLSIAAPLNGGSFPSNVRYIGMQSHERIKALLKYAGALLLTGSEVNPIMLLEAWASYTPVIAKAIDGNQEVMWPSYNTEVPVIGGSMYNEPNRGVVDFVLGKTNRFLGKDGHNQIMRLYQWSDLVERYKSVFEYLLNREIVNV